MPPIHSRSRRVFRCRLLDYSGEGDFIEVNAFTPTDAAETFAEQQCASSPDFLTIFSGGEDVVVETPHGARVVIEVTCRFDPSFTSRKSKRSAPMEAVSQ